MSNKILIIEDDAAIAEVLRLNLECADYTVTAFDNGLAAWNALAADHDYDLALLDMMLPGVDGFTLLPKLQEYGIPVICLTAMNDAQHEVQGLRGGAEDYIAKPFDMLALMVRMEKVLRRSGKFNEIYHFRDLTLDNGNRRLSRSGEEIPLPPLEFDVLAVLMKNKNRTVSRERILNESLNVSVGQKSANYDLIVPNSAIREDSNGKFILIVESKSSPLGNRYVATRVDVEVLASDDTQSAVSGALYGSEFVITTSTQPVEAGKLVRLANNS